MHCKKGNPNFRDITWNVDENLTLHEIFRIVSRFPRYISCNIAESRLPSGQFFLYYKKDIFPSMAFRFLRPISGIISTLSRQKMVPRNISFSRIIIISSGRWSRLRNNNNNKNMHIFVGLFFHFLMKVAHQNCVRNV